MPALFCGFQTENSISRADAILAMTRFGAHANFEENEKGSIEVGKMADFIVLNKDIMTVDIHEVPGIEVLETYISGERLK